MGSDIKSLPIIDIAPLLEKSDDPKMAEDEGVLKVVRQLDEACKEAGFFYVKGHGIPESLIKEAREVSQKFFDLPFEEKQKIKMTSTGHRGFQVLGGNRTSGTPDYHEAINCYTEIRPGEFGPMGGPMEGQNLWPDTPSNLKSLMDQYTSIFKELGRKIMRGLALALGGPADAFEGDIAGNFWMMRLLGYPGLSDSEIAKVPQIECSDIGCGAHTDDGLVTFINQTEDIHALQIRTRSGEWVNATPVPGTLVCVLGEMVKIISNGIYEATVHKVFNSSPLKRRISDPNVPKHKMKEFIIRLLYVEMLGHDASFGYIHAVKMTHDDSILLKRTGYLAVTLFLNEDHDLIILIVNTIQKDLRSDNYLVVCAALTAVCKLINEETIPAVLPQVVGLLGHAKDTVRKKAVMALHRFHRKAPAMVADLTSNFGKRLCDNDPGVMGATLCPLFDLITADVNSYKDLVVSFVSILKQVAERRLPKTYDYHQMPAPFIQIKLLKILALLGSGDKQASGHMYTVLGDIFRKCESSSNIGNAVLYECICCVSSIYPNPKLLDAAVEATSKFLKSDSHNLKYMGIDALGRLIKINPDIAEEHQLAVIDCLEDPDDTLKRKTFELLYKMTKSTNVEVIVDRMINYMISINDNHYKTEIASRCVELAEQFAPSNQWFIQTMNRVFEHAGDLVNIRVAHNLMRLIAEGFGEDDEGADSQLRSSAVDSYLRIIGEPKLPSVFLQVICWVLGEYGTADGKYSASYIIGKLCDVADAHSSEDTVKAYAITAIMKIFAFELGAGRGVEIVPECQSLIDELSASHSTDLQQRAYELQSLLGLDRGAIENLMPSDASCEDIEVDKNLSFLDSFVQQSIEKGARPYLPESERSATFNIENFRGQYQQEISTHSLRFEAYELPKPTPETKVPTASSLSTPSAALVSVPEPAYFKGTHHPPNLRSTPDVLSLSTDVGVKLRLDGVQKKWGGPPYSSSTAASSSSSTSTTQKTANGISHLAVGGSVDSRRTNQQAEVPAEKQKLAASLFGSSSSSKTEKKPLPSTHKTVKGSHKRTASSESSKEKPVAVVNSTPPPDLLDLGESAPSSTATADPFSQLEGLIAPNSASSNAVPSLETKAPDLLSLYSDTPTNNKNSHGVVTEMMATKKGPNPQDSLEKDATARQVGVTPTGNNPNLFRDLLG